MKYIVLLGDGMADFPLPELAARTPLEVAFTPSMDEVARLGIAGLFCPIPEDLPAGSDVGNLSLFGYDPKETYTGRAPLEAANQGLAVGPDQIAFRCNLVTLDESAMCDFTAGHITTEEAAEIVQTLDQELGGSHDGYSVRFCPGVGYRHLIILTPPADMLEALAQLPCTPPHDITGQAFAPHLPGGTVLSDAAALLRKLMEASQPILARHPVNAARVAAGNPPATSIWLWGQGGSPKMDTYRQRFNLTGAVISAVDLVNGIGVCAGLEVVKVPGATGYLDTNYKGKVAAALDALHRHDFVYLHIEAPDETSHQGRVDLKIRAIEDFDAYVVAPCLEYLKRHPHTRILVAPDHITAISTKTHAHGAVPFAMCGEGIQPNPAERYNERAAQETGILLTQGHTLVPHMLKAPTIDFPALNHTAAAGAPAPSPGVTAEIAYPGE